MSIDASAWNGVGHFVHRNRIVSQNFLAFDCFKRLLDKEKFDNIVEIGTYNGGLTVFLHEYIKETKAPTRLVSYDIRKPSHFDEATMGDIDIRIKDSFSPEATKEIADIIATGKTLILCDGGNKIGEFNKFAPMLKSGDFIMAHDYASTREFFAQNIQDKFWSWHEIWDEQIQSGLSVVEKYHDVDFTNAVWLCTRKP